MYKDTSPHLQKTREEIARRPLEKIESKDQLPRNKRHQPWILEW